MPAAGFGFAVGQPSQAPSQAVMTAWEGAWEGRPTGMLFPAARLRVMLRGTALLNRAGMGFSRPSRGGFHRQDLASTTPHTACLRR